MQKFTRIAIDVLLNFFIILTVVIGLHDLAATFQQIGMTAAEAYSNAIGLVLWSFLVTMTMVTFIRFRK